MTALCTTGVTPPGEAQMDELSRGHGDAIATLARRVADGLCASAVWDTQNERCNWVAARDIEDREIAPYSVRCAALSPELYSGSAGLALFLAESHACFGEPGHARTALGAWHRSVRYLREQTTPAPPFSFYAGHLGVAYTGHRLARAMPDQSSALIDDLHWLLDESAQARDLHHGLDQIGGNAGAVVPLLILAEALDRPDCLQAAHRLGDDIVAKAGRRGDQCFWEFEKVHGIEMDAPPMTGFSHGASGMAVALLELYARSGQRSYLETARGAFAFERALFDETAGNWIDTRYPYSTSEGKVTGVCRSAWCHGAPGIALAYLRAAALDPDRAEQHLHYGRIALATTLRFLDERRNAPLSDATLCHGVCGLSDIVLTAGLLLGDEALVETSHAFMKTFAELHPQPGEWPSGLTTHAPTLGLMIGNAGVGLHALRAHSRGAVPGVLLMQP